MAYEPKSDSKKTADNPVVTSYDSGYEHSFEHYVDLQCMVQTVEEEEEIPATLAFAS